MTYRPEEPAPPIGEFTLALRKKVTGLGLHLFLEPGRSIVGECGRPLDTRTISEEMRRQRVRSGGCRHERPDSSRSL